MYNSVSIIIPAKNEVESLKKLLPALQASCKGAEIIVVNDGSSDSSSEICQLNSVIEVKHPYSKGNGAAIKSGTRRATREILVFMDGDGQHRPVDVERLLNKLAEGYDMVVGARDASSQASYGRWAANSLYNRLATWMVGHQVDDLTSGFRVVRAHCFKQFLSLLPNGFSYPTTSTMALFRAGYSVTYIKISAEKRIGKSHINLMKDGVRFLLIIFKIGTLYSPLKLFTPISLMFAGLGACYYMFTFLAFGRFTNMSALLLSTAVLIFLMGLISEQITTLTYLSRGGVRASDSTDITGQQSDSNKHGSV